LRRTTGKAIKRRVFEILTSEGIEDALNEISQFPLRQVINPLFSFLYNGNPLVKWNTVTAMGEVTAQLADEDMESARIIIRRLMWNLNDESGGIGWGSPEALGEILANHNDLAEEYAPILMSYARENGNFQEHEMMQEGVLWGIGRLAQTRPDLVKDSAHYLLPYLDSPKAALRGLAAWIMSWVDMKDVGLRLEKLLQDEAELQIYMDRKLNTRRIMDVAREAIEKNREAGC
jgi:hypothetical protein